MPEPVGIGEKLLSDKAFPTARMTLGEVNTDTGLRLRSGPALSLDFGPPVSDGLIRFQTFQRPVNGCKRRPKSRQKTPIASDQEFGRLAAQNFDDHLTSPIGTIPSANNRIEVVSTSGLWYEAVSLRKQAECANPRTELEILSGYLWRATRTTIVRLSVQEKYSASISSSPHTRGKYRLVRAGRPHPVRSLPCRTGSRGPGRLLSQSKGRGDPLLLRLRGGSGRSPHDSQ